LRLQFRNNQKNFTFKLNSFRNVLVLSAVVLVIVIDARDVGWTGLARGGLTRRLEGHEGLKDAKVF
jgi:hypothetical protein